MTPTAPRNRTPRKTARKPAAAKRKPAAAAPHAASPRKVVAFAFGVVAVALALRLAMSGFAFGQLLSSKQEPEQQVPPTPLQRITSAPEFTEWIATWKTVDPYVSATEFSEALSSPLQEGMDAAPADWGAAGPGARAVSSNDRRRQVDFLAAYDGVLVTPFGLDSAAKAVAYEDGQAFGVAACDGGCTFDAVFWLDADRAVLLGTQRATLPGGESSCSPGADSGQPLQCHRRLTVDLLDFAARTRLSFLSSRHVLPSDPFDTAKRDRWIAGLSAEEKAALDVQASGEAVSLEGAVTYVDAEVGLITVVGEGGLAQAAALAPSAVLHDAANNRITAAEISIGDRVSFVARRDEDGSLTVMFGVRN